MCDKMRLGSSNIIIREKKCGKVNIYDFDCCYGNTNKTLICLIEALTQF